MTTTTAQDLYDTHYDSLCEMDSDPQHPMHALYLEARPIWAAVDTRRRFLDGLAETRDPMFLRAFDDYMDACDEPCDELDTEYLQRFSENAAR